MKRGNLNHMAFSLYLFLRDVAGRDFLAYVRQHFGDHQQGDGAINYCLQGFIGEVITIANVGPKLAHMALSCLFLTAYPGWNYRRVGTHMIAVDSLVHNFLHRTGILDSYRLDHSYGPRYHAQNGFLGVIQDMAGRIDCREFNPALPASFPRFIQYIWAYCGQSGENLQPEQVQARKAEPGMCPPPAAIVRNAYITAL